MAAAKTSAPATEPKVMVTIPVMPGHNDGVKSDPYEHVTVNGVTTYVQRGVPVEVSPEVFIQLRNKYPTI